ncbi:MAG: SDR family oxidoreductase [Candidatus Sigynarchaeota archaeon]
MTGTTWTLDGKICLITGATSGIGKATAFGLAKAGGTVVIVARNREKGTSVVQSIKEKTGNTKIDLLIADLSRQADIRNLASTFKQNYDRLHVLINNAGIILFQRVETVDGLEMIFAVNYLSQFLLTNLLLDVIKRSAPARIINMSSNAQGWWGTRLDLNDLQGKKHFSGFLAYAGSKLAIICFTYELARRLEGTGVTVNALHPGLVKTNFGRSDQGKGPGFLGFISTLFGTSPEKGARTSLYLAMSPDIEGVTGKYWKNCKQIRSAPISHDTGIARRLWDISEQLTGLKFSQ